jgi:hypothetical protein
MINLIFVKARGIPEVKRSDVRNPKVVCSTPPFEGWLAYVVTID